MNFHSAYDQGFVRVAACTPECEIADPAANAAEIMHMAGEGDANNVALMLFPELSLSGYAIDDLLGQAVLLDSVDQAVRTLVEFSRTVAPVLLVGAPIRKDGVLYNCAVAIHDGRILGVVPKAYPPNYREFYERRWFSSGRTIRGSTITVAGDTVPFGMDLLFAAENKADFVFHIEICEDVWVPTPPSDFGALAGATILTNLSASNITVGKAETRRRLCATQSSRALAAYVYSAAGPGESTTDLAWDGQACIYELGDMLAETARFPATSQMCVADIDVERLALERMRTGTFGEAALNVAPGREFRRIGFVTRPPVGDIGLRRAVARYPFVPADERQLAQDCYETFSIQVQGLQKRLKATGIKRLCIGISGGLDSTHAVIVACKAFDRLGIPRTNIHGYTMPGFGTSTGSRNDAMKLLKALGISSEVLDIRPAAKRMLLDIGHPFSRGERVYDVNFENVQAGLRTDFLFRLAGEKKGFVVGTGDLSELALGWCTYGVGDHMSHYNVNCGAPKTLIQHLIRWAAASEFDAKTGRILQSVLDREISPELVPIEAGVIQRTEDKVGPYELQDFNLYYITRYSLKPSKVAFLSWQAWQGKYTLPEIRKWLELFLFRFFTISQFKRSAVPNGPKLISGGALSPRGDWRAPSDGNAKIWLDELKANVPDM